MEAKGERRRVTIRLAAELCDRLDEVGRPINDLITEAIEAMFRCGAWGHQTPASPDAAGVKSGHDLTPPPPRPDAPPRDLTPPPDDEEHLERLQARLEGERRRQKLTPRAAAFLAPALAAAAEPPPPEPEETAPPPPAPLPDCAVCGNARARISAGPGDFAVAAVCPACDRACPRCGGRGSYTYIKAGYTYSADCECLSLRRRVSRFNRATLPAHYAARLLGANPAPEGYRYHPTQVRAARLLEQWAGAYRRGARGLLLSGNVGVGKTLLVCRALARLTLEQGAPARFVEFSVFCRELREQFGAEGPREALAAPLRDIDVLAVDELAKGRRTDWSAEELDVLISARYQAGKTTLFTTNHPIGDLEGLLGERLFSRLRERCFFFEIQGDDLRRGLAGQRPRAGARGSR